VKSLKRIELLWKAWKGQDRTSLESLERTGLLWKAWKGPDFFGKHGRDRASLESLEKTGLLWKAWKGQGVFGKPGKDRTSLESMEGTGLAYSILPMSIQAFPSVPDEVGPENIMQISCLGHGKIIRKSQHLLYTGKQFSIYVFPKKI
jgi:hypothetical protein